jgi:nitroreductase
MTLSAAEVNRLKHAPAVDGVLSVFHQRWSPRAFADRAVEPEKLVKAFEAARWAASSFNEQPWRYLVGLRSDSTYRKIFESLSAFNHGWAGSAPVLILGAANTRFSHNGSENGSAVYDLGAASSYLTLEAAALGLATHQMAGYNREAARAAFGIPEEYALGAVIALGYQGDPATISHEQMLAQEVAPRERRPLKDFVFSAWGDAAKLG